MGGIDSNLRFRVSNLSGILCQDRKYKKKWFKIASFIDAGEKWEKKKGE